MKGYICVYRQPIINPIDWASSQFVIKERPELNIRKFLSRYKRNINDTESRNRRFYDWGDDPGFFGAEEFLRDVRRASWGVCRRDVRKQLSIGDFVVFFCARQQLSISSRWNYYYIGVGTVGDVINNRRQIWETNTYREYRKFYNLLIDDEGQHREVLFPDHTDWENRIRAPYILFESSSKTHFNVRNPLLVATYDPKHKHSESSILESWRVNDEYVRAIEELIPNRSGGKKLRTSHKGNAHRHMNLSHDNSTSQLHSLRRRFLKISIAVAATTDRCA